MFTPHITPQSYYDDLAAQRARYITWINTPRVHTTPVVPALSPSDAPTKRSIKHTILNGI